MSLDLDFDDAQHAVAEAVAQFGRDRCDDDTVKALAGRFPEALWKELAELGLLAIATPEGDGGAIELVAALESLGGVAFPGPLADTYLATQVLPEAERAAVGAGERLVCASADGCLPWPEVADDWLVLETTGEGEIVRKLRPRSELTPIASLGGDPWARVAGSDVELGEPLPNAARGVALADLALAAYFTGAAARLVSDTAEHARTRVQFGRAIGEFQAVAHSLADVHIRVGSATTLTRAAASAFDGQDAGAEAHAAAARLAARAAALETSHTAHQLFGAVGATIEGPVWHISRRIRQLASHPLGLARARESVLKLLEGGAGGMAA